MAQLPRGSLWEPADMTVRRLACTLFIVSIAPAAAVADQVEPILDRVEARGANVHALQCQVIYTVQDRIADDIVTRHGHIIYKRKTPNPIFNITFTKTVQEDVVERKRSWYWFDGRWFYEAKESANTVIKRDVAPPGTVIDLFSIDQAPFPIPFGQKKPEILTHFDVALAPPDSNDPADTDHLVCTPKPESRLAKDYSRIEFFVSRSLHLPVKIVMTANPADRVTSAEFPDLTSASLNAELPDSKFQQPRETNGYSVVEE